MIVILTLSLLACMPDGAITDTAADDADSGDTEDTGSVDLDPLVGSYLPEDYAPESLARVGNRQHERLGGEAPPAIWSPPRAGSASALAAKKLAFGG